MTGNKVDHVIQERQKHGDFYFVFPASTDRLPNVVLMLGHRLWRCPTLKHHCSVFAGCLVEYIEWA